MWTRISLIARARRFNQRLAYLKCEKVCEQVKSTRRGRGRRLSARPERRRQSQCGHRDAMWIVRMHDLGFHFRPVSTDSTPGNRIAFIGASGNKSGPSGRGVQLAFGIATVRHDAAGPQAQHGQRLLLSTRHARAVRCGGRNSSEFRNCSRHSAHSPTRAGAASRTPAQHVIWQNAAGGCTARSSSGATASSTFLAASACTIHGLKVMGESRYASAAARREIATVVSCHESCT